jgi:hypothetical protein
MSYRVRILYCFVLAYFSLTIAFIRRSQSHAAQIANIAPPAANQADVEAAVALLCKPADISHSKTGSITGCNTCPKGTDFYSQKMGGWYFGAATVGHFTSAHDDNLILDGSNCDSHASNWGGSFVFAMVSGKPKLLKYDRNLRTDQCHKYLYADGREFLVCRGGWSGQGEFDAYFFLAKFDATGKDIQTVVFRTRNMSGSCGPGSDDSVEGADIKDAKFDAKDSSALTSMTITATNGTLTCAQAKAKKASGKDPASMKTYQIQFLFDGKQFTVAPASRAALQAFPQQ